MRPTIPRIFTRFFESQKASAMLLLACTIVSLAIANSPWGAAYRGFWHSVYFGLSVEHWINDGLMPVFFLLIGLELERELYVGELANLRNALLPVVAALGGIMVPALIHFTFNFGMPTRAGASIPMATDIAFALGVLALLGERIRPSLRIFLAALAVIDDLGAIIVIALFYTAQVSLNYLLGALAVLAALIALNRIFRVMLLLPYLLGGALLWWLTLKSGVHATIAGVVLAFAIPFSAVPEDTKSPSHRLEQVLYRPVAFIVLPIFALANTCIVIDAGWQQQLLGANATGIIAGLLLGKPLGITLLSFIAVSAGVCRLPADLGWRHIFGAGLLGGIGFTMSIFITNLAFAGDAETINTSKMAILIASLCAGVLGYLALRFISEPSAAGRSR